jgi:hypothetical protein
MVGLGVVRAGQMAMLTGDQHSLIVASARSAAHVDCLLAETSSMSCADADVEPLHAFCLAGGTQIRMPHAWCRQSAHTTLLPC